MEDRIHICIRRLDGDIFYWSCPFSSVDVNYEPDKSGGLTTTMAMKLCSKCGVPKLGTEFYKDRAAKGGLQSYCKRCDKERRKYRCGGKRDGMYKVGDRTKLNTYKRAYRRRNIVKALARDQVHNCIRKRVLVKCPCEVCGRYKVEAHHCDYLKPLDVMWLCKEHHNLWHQHLKAYDVEYRPQDDELVKALLRLKYRPEPIVSGTV